MCNRCPKVHDPNARGFWAGLAKKHCECECSCSDLQIVQEEEDTYVGTDELGRQNFSKGVKTYAFCTRCKHKFRI